MKLKFKVEKVDLEYWLVDVIFEFKVFEEVKKEVEVFLEEDYRWKL